MLSAILRDTPPPARSLRKELPEELDRILAKALEKDVEYRYQHVADVVADLKRVRRETGAAAVRPQPTAFRLRVAWILGLVGGVAIGALVARRAWTRRSGPLQFQPALDLPRLASRAQPVARRPHGGVRRRLAGDAPGLGQAAGRRRSHPDHLGRAGRRQSALVAEGRPDRLRAEPEGDLVGAPARRASAPDPRARDLRELLPRRRAPRLRSRHRSSGPRASTAATPGRWRAFQSNFYSFYLNHCAAVSPDGQWLAYFQPESGHHGDFWLIPAAGGTPRRLTSDVEHRRRRRLLARRTLA